MVEQRELETLLTRLREKVTTAYFDPRRRSVITCDASPVGVSGVCAQIDEHGRLVPITFVSRALTPTECRYSQLEREALSIVFSVERLHRFIFGSSFDIITDHKPLVTLPGKPNAKLSARLERWRLRLTPYDYVIRYEPGEWNAADWVSSS